MGEKDSSERKEQSPRYEKAVVPAMLAALIFILFGGHGVFESPLANSSFSGMVLPSVAILAIIAATGALDAALEGDFVRTLNASLLQLGLGVFLFLLLIELSMPESIQPMPYPILYLFILTSVYRVVSFFVNGRPLLRKLLKSVTLLLGGIIIHFMFSSLIPKSAVSIDEATTLDFELLSYSLLRYLLPVTVAGAGVATSVSALRGAKNDSVSVVGKWIESHSLFLGLVAGLFWLYLVSFRELASVYFGDRLVIFEWGVVAFISACAYLALRQSFKEDSESLTFGSWMKHQKKEELFVDAKQKELSEAVERFVEDGSKGDITVYLIKLASEKNLSRGETRKAVKELLDYRDREIPNLTTRWGAERIKERNKENREEVLKRTIEKVGEGAKK